MPLLPSHLVVDLSAASVERALRDWHWLVGPDARPLCITAGGDVILWGNDDRVLLLDTGSGWVESVAESMKAFEDALSDSANLDDWFSASLVDRLGQQGTALGPGQCYGYTTLPVFAEGSYEAENRFVLSALEHLVFTADVHRQIRDLPDGTSVRIRVRD